MIDISIELLLQMLDKSDQSDLVPISGLPFSMLDDIWTRLV